MRQFSVRWWVSDPAEPYRQAISAIDCAPLPEVSENDHYRWAVMQCACNWGRPLDIGAFTPVFGDMAYDASKRLRTWDGSRWHPYLGDDCDSTPCAPISQSEAMEKRGYLPFDQNI